MNVIVLRPRAFIPFWNRHVYTNFIDWARWFWKGAVHIDDVASAVILSVELVSRRRLGRRRASTRPQRREKHDGDQIAEGARGPNQGGQSLQMTVGRNLAAAPVMKERPEPLPRLQIAGRA